MGQGEGVEPLLTRAQSRTVDEELARDGMPTVLLMENAGRGAAEHARAMVDQRGLREVRVLAGPGNNGGDGLVLARHLALAGVPVRVACVRDAKQYTGDAALARDAWLAVGGTCEAATNTFARAGEGTLLVDALFGTGLTRPLEGLVATLVEAMNRREARSALLALDVPSGLDADTGAPLGGSESAVVRADATSTFGTAKPGHYTGAGREHSGDVRVVALGARIPPRVLAQARAWRVASESHIVEARTGGTHKGDHGRVLIVGGSAGTTGAALLSSHGALRMGAGLVSIASRASEAIAPQLREAMLMPLAHDEALARASIERAAKNTVLAVGMGLGRDAWASAVVRAALATGAPLVLDADALGLLIALRDEGMFTSETPRVLTPHPLEMARLLGHEDVVRINADRFGAAREAAAHYSSVVLLKGAGTVIAAPDGRAWVLDAAEPVLGVAGSGDVLAGAIAARLAERGFDADPTNRALRAALEGSSAHLRAGLSLRRERGSSRGALAHEIADRLGVSAERP